MSNPKPNPNHVRCPAAQPAFHQSRDRRSRRRRRRSRRRHRRRRRRRRCRRRRRRHRRRRRLRRPRGAAVSGGGGGGGVFRDRGTRAVGGGRAARARAHELCASRAAVRGLTPQISAWLQCSGELCAAQELRLLRGWPAAECATADLRRQNQTTHFDSRIREPVITDMSSSYLLTYSVTWLPSWLIAPRGAKTKRRPVGVSSCAFSCRSSCRRARRCCS